MSRQELDSIHAELLARRTTPPTSLSEARDGYDRLCKRFPVPSQCTVNSSELANVPAQIVESSSPTRSILYVHGGGFLVGSAEGFSGIAGTLAVSSSATAYVLDYRLAPEHPYPAARNDVLDAYEEILKTQPGSEIALVGDSAGAQLILSSLLEAKAKGIQMPGCVVLLSPWVDLSLSGESIQTKASIDPFLSVEKLRGSASAYLSGLSVDPLPILAADLKGLPPLLIQVGEEEILLDDACALARAAGAAGVEVTLEVWPKMFHVWHMFAPALSEGRKAIAIAANFINSMTQGRS
ncbi:alpha/beta hydrolase [Pseudomonas sp. LABIM340]|uniref:alpha/beta hydrolase n=1 Tax=Pseudomonas sp. LABIM340 TaxID=3156585 RepID=UPI0032AF9487